MMATNYGMAGGVGGGEGEGDGDGALAVRLVWEWLMESTRLNSVRLENEAGQNVVITFGVSMALLTLTHPTRWWVERRRERILCACRDYLVLLMKRKKRPLYCIQDRATGRRAQLVARDRQIPCDANWKWMVLCDCEARELIVVEIPRKSTGTTTTATKNPTVVVVPLDTSKGKWTYCSPYLGGTDNQDHVLLLFAWPGRFFEIAWVDLVQTCASKALAVLSSTVPRFSDVVRLDPHLIPSCAMNIFLGKTYFVVTQESGAHSFVMQGPDLDGVITIEEGTARLHKPLDARDMRVSKLNESQFCVFVEGMDTYTVWDINDTREPVCTKDCASGQVLGQSFVEGGLLFQVSESCEEIQLFTPLTNFCDWFSEALS
ncbi:hypothetical protein Pelo_6481 [Pelomyxa schiedti]|nr:hypothetical protein Pelo_6481 [Pelomyxa schiedti]